MSGACSLLAPAEYVQLTWGNWSDVCAFVPHGAFLGGTYLDDETKEPLPDGRASNTMGVRVLTPSGVALAKQGDYLIRIGGKVFCLPAETFESTFKMA